MTPNEYQKLAFVTVKRLPELKDDLLHALTGIHSEGGEIASTVKRVTIYNQPLDVANLKEEIGDILWYIALLASVTDLNLEDCMIQNIDKLKKRYPEGYTDLAAITRADKIQLKEGILQKLKLRDDWEWCARLPNGEIGVLSPENLIGFVLESERQYRAEFEVTETTCTLLRVL